MSIAPFVSKLSFLKACAQNLRPHFQCRYQKPRQPHAEKCFKKRSPFRKDEKRILEATAQVLSVMQMINSFHPLITTFFLLNFRKGEIRNFHLKPGSCFYHFYSWFYGLMKLPANIYLCRNMRFLDFTNMKGYVG